MRSSFELVGVVNITPDSFSDGGLYETPTEAIKHTQDLFDAGAGMVDVGAESTRPDATPLDAKEEWDRLRPVLGSIIFSYPGQISLDTYHPETVQAAVREAGDVIVNDVTGLNNPKMREVVTKLGLRCIISHLPSAFGQDIQSAHKTNRKVDSVSQVIEELMERRVQLMASGVEAQRIILDPGIGFGKTPELNWELLSFAQHVPDIDVMVGYSRKRFLGPKRMELAPNLAAGNIAVEAGTKYLRVHDVAGHARGLHKH